MISSPPPADFSDTPRTDKIQVFLRLPRRLEPFLIALHAENIWKIKLTFKFYMKMFR